MSRILRDIELYEAEKKEIAGELTSNFYDRAMARAQARGSNVIEKQDVEAVFAESEDPKEIAAGYMQAYVSSLNRAGIVSRTIAFLIDSLILFVVLAAVMLLIFVPFWALFPGQFDSRFMENGHDVFVQPAGLMSVLVTFFATTAVLATILVYFIVIEGRFGCTPGKWLLGLRVLREDGTRIGYTEAIIRNIPKIVGNSVFLVIDALLMLFVFGKDKQRGFDKVAKTIVVHKSKKEA